MTPPRREPGKRATREQAVEEWRLHLQEVFSQLIPSVDQFLIDEQAKELAEEIIGVVEQAVRVNAGKGLP